LCSAPGTASHPDPRRPRLPEARARPGSFSGPPTFALRTREQPHRRVEFRWSSRAELSSPGSELIVTRSPGRRASAHQSRPAPGPVSSGRSLVCGFVRSRRKSEKLQALSATRDGPVSPETSGPRSGPSTGPSDTGFGLTEGGLEASSYVRSYGRFQLRLSFARDLQPHAS